MVIGIWLSMPAFTVGNNCMDALHAKPERNPLANLVIAAIAAASIVAACVPVPNLNPEISDDELVLIEKGKTTYTDVKAVLGDPTIIWETERVWVYEGGPSGALLFFLGGAYSATIVGIPLANNIVIMRFDENGRVERVERRHAPLEPFTDNYGTFLRAWLAEDGKEVDTEKESLRTDTGG